MFTQVFNIIYIYIENQMKRILKKHVPSELERLAISKKGGTHPAMDLWPDPLSRWIPNEFQNGTLKTWAIKTGPSFRRNESY